MTTFKTYLQSQGKSKSTVEHYYRYLLDFISYLDQDGTEPEAATAKEVLAYLSALQARGLEAATRSIRLNVIKHYFNWQVTTGSRSANPVSHLKIRGSRRQTLYPILSRVELDGLYLNYPTLSADDPNARKNWFTYAKLSRQRNKVKLSLMIHQGLTTREVDNLTVADLQLREGKIFIQGGRKSNERTLDLKPNQILDVMEYTLQVRQLLLNYQQNKENKRLFLPTPVVGRKQASQESTFQVWKGLSKELKAQQQAGKTRFVNFKQVRTSVITHWLKHYNLRQVQYMAGHRYVSSTERYLVNQTEDLQKDVNQFHPF